jgi:phage protein D
MTTQDARRAQLLLTYNGIEAGDIFANTTTRFSYSDYMNKLDELTIDLGDKNQQWQGDWMPEQGDSIKASIHTINWSKAGESKTLPLGIFEVDSFSVSGPPDTCSIQATSLPAGSKAKHEKRSRAWEKVTLKRVAQDVASSAGLKLLYEFNDNPTYERLDQTEQSDLAFLFSLIEREGAALKVSSGNLVIFDEAMYEKKPTVCTITRTQQTNYSFNWSSNDAVYVACQLTYTDTSNKKPFSATYKPPGAPNNGPVLKISQYVESEAEALRLAKQSLRERNKNYGKGSLSLPGDVRMAAGVTIEVKGWKKFDGKYIVESATHSVDGGGYTTRIEIRKVLGW